MAEDKTASRLDDQFKELNDVFDQISKNGLPSTTRTHTTFGGAIAKRYRGLSDPTRTRKAPRLAVTKTVTMICVKPGTTSVHNVMKNLDELSALGFGLPPGCTKEKPQIRLSKSLGGPELRLKILEFWPRLISYDYMRAPANGSKLVCLPEEPTPDTFGRLLNRARLIIMPTVIKDIIPESPSPNQTCKAGHTLSTGETVCLICDQDEDYAKSLTADREKDKKVSWEIAYQEELRKMRSDATFNVAKFTHQQPCSVVKLQLPDDSLNTQISDNQTGQDFMDFVHSQPNSSRNFLLKERGSGKIIELNRSLRRPITSLLSPGTVIIVIWKHRSYEQEKSLWDSEMEVTTEPLNDEGVFVPDDAITIPLTDSSSEINRTSEEMNSDEEFPPLLTRARRRLSSTARATRVLSDIVEPSATELTLPSASIEEEPESQEDLSLAKLLEKLEKGNEDVKPNIVNVSRQKVLEGATRAFRKKNFNIKAPVDVKFCGEDGADEGGVTREFLTLLMHEIDCSCLFDGPCDNRILALDANALEEGKYEIVGQMMAYSLANRGPLPQFLSVMLYTLIASPTEAPLSVSYLPEGQLKDSIVQVQAAENDATYWEALENIDVYIEVAGCNALGITVSLKDRMVNALLRFHLVHRIQQPLEQLRKGLSSLGVLDLITKHPDTMKSAFVRVETVLTHDLVQDLFRVEWSEKGSNHHTQECEIISYWNDFLEEMEGEFKLEQVLSWITGSREIPCLGFKEKPSIAFKHQAYLDITDPRNPFPEANTCTLKLTLPISKKYELFRDRFLAAMSVNTFTNH